MGALLFKLVNIVLNDDRIVGFSSISEPLLLSLRLLLTQILINFIR